MLPMYVFIELLFFIKIQCTKHVKTCWRKYKRAKKEPMIVCEATHLPVDGIAMEIKTQRVYVV